jgi:hypothetical protein
VGEVKSVLTTQELRRCIAAGARFKQLRPTYQPADRVQGLNEAKAPFEETGGAAILRGRLRQHISRKKLGRLLNDAELVALPEGKGFDGAKGNDLQPPLGALCVLGQGSTGTSGRMEWSLSSRGGVDPVSG